jgi:hypothetical protein
MEKIARNNGRSRAGKTKASPKIIVVDGSNIAHAECTSEGAPKICNIVSVFKLLKAEGYKPIIIVDAALRHQIDDHDQYEALVRKRWIRQAPARTVADYFILKTAEKQKAAIVSNDSYKQYLEEFRWISDRRQPFMIVDGNVVLYDKDVAQRGLPQKRKPRARPRKVTSQRPAKSN